MTRQEEREQPPVIWLDGDPVFEVWFWHSRLRRWFVLSKSYNTHLQLNGVIFFDTQEDLLAKLRAAT